MPPSLAYTISVAGWFGVISSDYNCLLQIILCNLLNVQQLGNFNSSPVAASPTLLSCRPRVFTDTFTGNGAYPSSTRARVTYPACSSTLYCSSSYRTVTTKGNKEEQDERQVQAQCAHIHQKRTCTAVQYKTRRLS